MIHRYVVQDGMVTPGSHWMRMLDGDDATRKKLLVREMIQNSLDAWDGESEVVTVSFRQFEVCGTVLGKYFLGLPDELLSSKLTMLEISDNGTTGLDGGTGFGTDEVKLSKFNDLIYKFGASHHGAGSGGTWGVGKMAAFHAGLGMVIYLTKIKTQDGFEHRLAAKWIEDEDSTRNPSRLMIDAPLGICTWGSTAETPVTDFRIIEDLCREIGIEPLKKPGTTIVVVSFEDPSPSFVNDISKEAMRWFFPRILKNDEWNLPKLKIQCSGEPVRPSLVPGLGILFDHISTLLRKSPVPIVDGRNINGYLANLREVEFSHDELEAGASRDLGPINLLKGAMDCEDDPDKSRTIIAFVRKPGMVVRYCTCSEITCGDTDPGKWKIILVSINQSCKVTHPEDEGKELLAEEYFRKSEGPDHTSWDDKKWNHKPGARRLYSRRIISELVRRMPVKQDKIEGGQAAYGMGIRLGSLLLGKDSNGDSPEIILEESNDGPIGSLSPLSTKRVKLGNIREITNKLIARGYSQYTLVCVIGSNAYMMIDMKVRTSSGYLDKNGWKNKTGYDIPATCEVKFVSVSEVGKHGRPFEKCNAIQGFGWSNKRSINAGESPVNMKCEIHICQEDPTLIIEPIISFGRLGK